MWHCRQAVICLINIFKRGTMMALIIISPLLKHLEAFSSFPPFDCHSSKTQPKAASAVPLRLHTLVKKTKVSLSASQDLNDLLGFFLVVFLWHCCA